MELKYIEEKRIHNIAIIRKFLYGPFEISVTIDLDGPIEIIASDKYQEVVIKAINHEKAIVSIEGTYLSTSKQVNEFVEKCKTASELLELINNNRDKLVKKEDHYD